jgi:two-component system response regulator QseB
MRALVIEDNRRLAGLVVDGLRRGGFVADAVHDLASADDALAATGFDLIVLDLGLPDGDGLDWLKTRRAQGLAVPVLIASARGALDQRVAGLDTGADDYVVKPFETEELLARCRALLRRPGATLGVELVVGRLALDTIGRNARVGERGLDLGRREIDLLELLLRRIDTVVPRTLVEERLYGFDDEVTPNAVEAAVSRLRRKLAEAGAPVAIHTVRGIGYMARQTP